MRRSLFFLTLLLMILFSFFINTLYKQNVLLAKDTIKSNVKYDVEPISITGQILAFDLNTQSATVMVRKINHVSVREKWRIRFKTIEPLEAIIEHSTYTISFKVNRNQYQYLSPKNKYAFDYDQYLFSNGISRQYQVLSVDDAVHSNWFSLAQIRLKIRQKINLLLSNTVEESASAFLKALLLGDKGTFEDYEHYKQLGLAHIFAISGLHFGLIHKSLKQIIFIPYPKVKAVLMILLMSVLLLAIGNGYSAQRAFLMMLYSEMCFLIKRKNDILTNLSFSLFVILMIEPAAILNSGLHLSYYAYVCVAILYKQIFKTALNNKILESFRFSVSIQVMLLPATLYYFQSANLYGFLANFLAVPLIGLILPMALLFVLAGITDIPFIAYFIGRLLEWCIHGFSWLASKFPLNLSAFIGFKKSDFYGLLLILGGVALIMVFWSLFDRRKTLLKVGVPLLVAFILLIGAFDHLKIQITFFDVGHGDMSLIQVGDYTSLIDTGDGKNAVSETLRARGVHKINTLILSHEHHDHVGDLENILNTMQVDAIYINHSTYTKISSILEDFSGEINVLDGPVELNISPLKSDSVTLTLIPIQGKNASSDPNDDALAVKFTHNHLTGYFLGDLSTEATDLVLKKFPPNSTDDLFVKIPHHGSKTSLNQPFYENANLQLAVTSHSTKYSMPHSEVESSLLANGVTHFSTYKHGEINLIVKKKRVYIMRYLQPFSLFKSALLLN